MPSQGSIRAGLAFVEISLKDSTFTKGLEKAGKSLKEFGKSVSEWGKKVAEIGAGITAPLLAASKIFADMGGNLARASQRTGASVEWLSEAGFAAEETGTDFETLEKGVRKMQKSLLEAAEGSSGAQRSLALLGLTVKDLSGMSPEKQFELIGQRLEGIQDPAVKAGAAMQIFGRSGTELLPMLENMTALRDEAKKLGLTISATDAGAAEHFSKTLDTCWRVLKQTAFVIGAELAPTLTKVAETITAVVVQGTNWIKSNGKLVVSSLKVGAAIIAGGIAIVGFGYAIVAIGSVITGVAAIVGGIGTAFGVMAAVLGAILSPIGLVIAAVAAVGYYIVFYTQVGAQALAWLGKQFGFLVAVSEASLSAIGDALAAGDIAAAAKVLWSALKIAWDEGVALLDQVWSTCMEAMEIVGATAFYGVLATVEEVWHAIKSAWIEGTAFISKIWGQAMSLHAKAVEGLANGMVKSWIYAQEKTGNITKEEADRQRNSEDNQTQSDFGDIDEQQKKQQSDLEAQRQDQLKNESARHEKRMGDIGTEYNAVNADAKSHHDQQVKQDQDELHKSTEAWLAAVSKAHSDKDKGSGLGDFQEKLQKLIAQFSGLGDVMDEKQQKIGVRGTFNAADARAFSADGPTDQLINNTAQSAAYAKKLYDVLKDAKALFT